MCEKHVENVVYCTLGKWNFLFNITFMSIINQSNNLNVTRYNINVYT